MFEEHHNLVFNILWEMVVSSNMDLKINAANLLKAIVSMLCAYVLFVDFSTRTDTGSTGTLSDGLDEWCATETW
ncbi:hypothetical protein Tco_0494179 [Tanacetum coccineum]